MAKSQAEYLKAMAGTNASNDAQGEFLKHGEYVLEHDSVKFNGAGFHGPYFAATLKVLEATPIGDSKPNPVGTTIGMVFKAEDLYGLKGVKSMICGTFGEDPESTQNQEEMAGAFALVIGPEQKLHGQKVRVRTFLKTSAKGVQLVLPVWSEYKTEASVAA